MNHRPTDRPPAGRPGSKSSSPSAREIWIRLLLYPGHTLPTAAAPVVVGLGLAWRDGVFAFWPAFLGFLGSWSIHVGGVFADNHQLLRRHIQVPEHPELLAAVADGTLRLRSLWLATLACFVLGALPAPWLVARGGWPVLAIGAIGVLASYGYAGRGIVYARRGIADIVFFLMFGEVAVAATWFIQASASPLPTEVFVVGVPIGALVVCVLVIDDIRDRGFDADKGWRTPTVRFGLRFSRIELSALTALAYLAPVACWLGLGMSPLVFATWLTLPSALGVARAVWRSDTTMALRPMSARMSLVSFAFAGLFALGIAASGRALH